MLSMASPIIQLPAVSTLSRIGGGELLIGDDSGLPDERPAHLVHLRSFLVGQSPVTNDEFSRFLTDTGAEAPPFFNDDRFNDPSLPVVGVSWHDAVAFCDWLASRTGIRCRLPTEAEREYAARGGLKDGAWPWSTRAGHPLATQIGALDRPHVPSPECANGYGLRCMGDNVHEWCSNWYGATYFPARGAEALAAPGRRRRAGRGGSWRHAVKFTRVTARASLDPTFHYNDFGFRLYRDG